MSQSLLEVKAGILRGLLFPGSPYQENSRTHWWGEVLGTDCPSLSFQWAVYTTELFRGKELLYYSI